MEAALAVPSLDGKMPSSRGRKAATAGNDEITGKSQRKYADGYPTDHVNCWLHSLLRTVKVKKPRKCNFSYLHDLKGNRPNHNAEKS